jgi:hypothetical protein
MALKGNLREFSLVQLLNLINLAKKTGALYIDGGNQTIRLFFREGKLAFAIIGNNVIPLIRVMARSKLIPNSLAASIGERYKNLTDKELGIYLINSGYLSQDQIFFGIETFLKEIIRRLFTLKEGFFHFEMSELPPDQAIQVHVDLESIIIEGSRQQHEMENLSSEIPSLEMSLKFTDRPGMNIRNVNLNAEEWRVVSYVNPRNTIAQIAGAAKLDELQIRRVVFDLLQAGLVELIHPTGNLAPAVNRTLPRKDPIELIPLVNRVINRIKAI